MTGGDHPAADSSVDPLAETGGTAVRQHTGVERTADGTRRNLERDQDTAVGIFTDLGGYADRRTGGSDRPKSGTGRRRL